MPKVAAKPIDFGGNGGWTLVAWWLDKVAGRLQSAVHHACLMCESINLWLGNHV